MPLTSAEKINQLVPGKFLLGVNYWSRAGGPRMWERFDKQRVIAELKQMKAIGLNAFRCFAFIPSLITAKGNIDQTVVSRMAGLFALCEQADLMTIPTFLVGHMSGENYDFFGQSERNLYRDPQLLAEQIKIANAVVGAARNSQAVIAYLLSNEMPYWGGKSDVASVAHWVETLVAAVRQHDQRPIGVGDGVMNVVDGGQNGFCVDTLAKHVDFFGPHSYHADTDQLRQAFNAEFSLRALSYLRMPLIFEEFGGSTTQVAEDHQAIYYRELLHSSLTVGACGALSWCFSDFEMVDEPPYRHHAFELGFGITATDGREKPVCNELRAFSQLVGQIDFAELRSPPVRAALIVPSYFYHQYPFCWEDRSRMRRVLLQSYTIASLAGIELELVPEEQSLDRYQLILAPATQKLLAPTWRDLKGHAQRGAEIYWSYYGGDFPFHQGAWCHNFSELTGCEHRLRYGLCDLPSDSLVLDDQRGTEIRLDTTVGAPYSRSRLPIALKGAQPLMHDDAGRPALVRQAHGKGGITFCSYPLEYYLAQNYEQDLQPICRLYRQLAERAACRTPIAIDSATIQARTLRTGKQTLLWLFNRSWSEQTASIDAPAATALFGCRDRLRPGRQQISLPPKAIAVYRTDGPT
ncbi:MAG: beta-galactosidase trimerization domain-containing protein [Deltaproteobacteria bacterium]|nr:beta-galactosidase trimerization domain-containing protein [Deltaproteobacteria bacterium]